jgi:hypothetical protein
MLLFTACAPEPTSPADTDLGGLWTSNANMFSLSEIRMNLIQEPRGIVSGTWSAKGSGGRGGCAPNVPCNASGQIIGRNTVSQVQIELLGAGKFEGGLVELNKLRGVFVIVNDYDTISFARSGCIACEAGKAP